MDSNTPSILQLDGNTSRPTVVFNAVNGQLHIIGRSILENSIRFYEPLLEWIVTYIKNPASKTEFHMELEYFNTSTSKYLLQLMQQLEVLCDRGNEVLIVWYYSDEDMRDLGVDYQQIVHIPFEFRKLNNFQS